jgi:tetratricopeptide (TPR) repeat protein
LERFIKLCPGEKEGYYNRARVALDRGDVEAALEDFSHALELDPDWVRIYFARAIARDRFGDCEGANRDREQGLRREPHDEISWVVRGIARANDGDNEGAVADYDQAILLNPRSFPAYQNKIYLLSVKRHDTAGALTVLDRMVEIFPDNLGIRADRGLHRARLGLREGALDDAQAALDRNPTPTLFYKVAGLYAQTSLVEPSDRGQALGLLSRALRAGYGIDTLAKDHDLDPIRDDAEFQELAASARSLHAITNSRPATSPAKSKAQGR